MELIFVCLEVHDSEFRQWTGGVDRRICQTFAASPAEPGELLLGFRFVSEIREPPHLALLRAANIRPPENRSPDERSEIREPRYKQLRTMS
jgi:hypothetical protein